MSAWVYILELCNGKFYIGSTANINQRIIDHSLGKSPYTKKYLPIKLKFKNEYQTLSEASKMEKYLKKLKNRKVLEKIIIDQKIMFSW